MSHTLANPKAAHVHSRADRSSITGPPKNRKQILEETIQQASVQQDVTMQKAAVQQVTKTNNRITRGPVNE